ncbi:hypothetical protein D9619_003776 [Psilocybe cf. subviscida]|uniref:Uncharacterized protein n=1 Tax=Psilocybe cf. subviscida TaxID=2480587 RepID=A0A8H5ETX6_9AGAR|nr:hypothetical protein D9619_003776 [Psilocybe cf. subviscida]
MSVLLSSRPESPRVNIGAMLVGSYINTILYGLAMLCVYLYRRSRRSRRDPLFVKLAVAASAVFDTVATFGVCANVYYLTVSHWGRYDSEFRTHWTAVLWFLCLAFSEFIVQVFMVRRYFIMSRHFAFSAFIIVFVIFSLEANLYLGIATAIGTLPVEDRITDIKPALLSLCSTAFADLLTTCGLFWKLKKADTYSRITHEWGIFSRRSKTFTDTYSYFSV